MPTSGEPVLIYCDSSALVKLVAEEAESAALELWLAERAEPVLVSSVLARTEVVRAVRRLDDDALSAALELLETIGVVELDADLTDEAALLDPASLRSLDALHLASVRRLGLAVAAFVAYDARLAEAAGAMGLPLVRPGLQ